MSIQHIHHVAYRCKDAKETVEWYAKYLDMDFVLAIAENQVPSTKAPDPYMHIFLDAGMGNILAFFEIPNSPEMGKDPNTPDWVQHLALKIEHVQSMGARLVIHIPGLPADALIAARAEGFLALPRQDDDAYLFVKPRVRQGMRHLVHRHRSKRVAYFGAIDRNLRDALGLVVLDVCVPAGLDPIDRRHAMTPFSARMVRVLSVQSSECRPRLQARAGARVRALPLLFCRDVVYDGAGSPWTLFVVAGTVGGAEFERRGTRHG